MDDAPVSIGENAAFEPQPPGHGIILGLTETPDGMICIRAPHGIERGGCYLLRPDALEWEEVSIH